MLMRQLVTAVIILIAATLLIPCHLITPELELSRLCYPVQFGSDELRRVMRSYKRSLKTSYTLSRRN